MAQTIQDVNIEFQIGQIVSTRYGAGTVVGIGRDKTSFYVKVEGRGDYGFYVFSKDQIRRAPPSRS